MPQRPKRACNWRGCHGFTITKHRFCEIHRKQAQNEYVRKTDWHKLYNSRWRKVRIQYLRQNPLCVMCKKDGVLKAATEVDHIEPHKGDAQKFWNQDNWQGLCKQCHSAKSQRERNEESKM